MMLYGYTTPKRLILVGTVSACKATKYDFCDPVSDGLLSIPVTCQTWFSAGYTNCIILIPKTRDLRRCACCDAMLTLSYGKDLQSRSCLDVQSISSVQASFKLMSRCICTSDAIQKFLQM